MKFIDQTGKRFGRLLVIKTAGSRGDKRLWLCVCDCGRSTKVTSSHLFAGHTKSCGCLKSQIASLRLRTHGMSTTREYRSWIGAIYRCYDKNRKGYKYYGGRGISVCERWLHSFENFYADMGQCAARRSLDRKDNDGNYEPSNCRWATKHQQSINKRQSPVGTSGFRGIYPGRSKNRWVARIYWRSKIICIGTFGSKLEAKTARDKTILKIGVSDAFSY